MVLTGVNRMNTVKDFFKIAKVGLNNTFKAV